MLESDRTKGRRIAFGQIFKWGALEYCTVHKNTAAKLIDGSPKLKLQGTDSGQGQKNSLDGYRGKIGFGS